MLKKPARAFVIAAVVLCGVALVRLWPEGPAQGVATPPLPSRGDSMQQAPADPRGPPATFSSSAAGEAPVLPPTVSLGAAPVAPTPRQASVAPVRLRVQAPADVRVGQVFEAQIELEADRGVRELLFTVTFAKSRLALVGWTEGDFAQQGGLPGETVAQEPSDGNVQVTFRVTNGLSIAGAGTIIALQFEATRAGASSIMVGDVYAVGSNGAAEREVAILETGTVTIH